MNRWHSRMAARTTRVRKSVRAARSLMRFMVAALLITPLLAAAGTWQTLKNPPPLPDIFDPSGVDQYPGGAAFPLLLTDGGVMVQNVGDGKIFKLTPDLKGSYVNGTWSQLATMPYVSYAGAQAVLPDGRVIMEGGEYSDFDFKFLLTNNGAIYDPVADKWTRVTPPSFFVDLYPPRAVFAPHPIGDSQSVVLPNGTFMLADKMSRQAALLDPKNLTWTETGTSSKSDLNDEEGWTLLPNGKVLTVDCYTDFFFGLIPSYPTNPTNSEIYDPETGQWSSAGSTINTLTDPATSEFGPAVLRPNGSVFAVGSQGYTSIYHSRSGKWSVGPRLPISPQGYQYTAQDAPGALLPDGNVLFAVSGGAEPPGGGYSNPPLAFFEFDGHRLIPEPAIPNAPFETSSAVNLLVLPTGQILAADGSKDIEIYTPNKHIRDHEQEDENENEQEWAPVILWGPRELHPGRSYQLSGRRFNGMSQASMFGDEGQSATNYPLVRITNLSTHHVFYSRTHDHSSMAVASDDEVSTHFDVPGHQELGLSKLEVVANGIASEPLMVVIK
jgi:hypothetical protein